MVIEPVVDIIHSFPLQKTRKIAIQFDGHADFAFSSLRATVAASRTGGILSSDPTCRTKKNGAQTISPNPQRAKPKKVSHHLGLV